MCNPQNFRYRFFHCPSIIVGENLVPKNGILDLAFKIGPDKGQIINISWSFRPKSTALLMLFFMPFLPCEPVLATGLRDRLLAGNASGEQVADVFDARTLGRWLQRMEHNYRRIATVNLCLHASQPEIALFMSDFSKVDQSRRKRLRKQAINDCRDPSATLTWLPRQDHLP
jgi:hypothetical protein